MYVGNKELFGAPFLVLANKQDAPRAVAAIEIKDQLGLNEYDSHTCDVQPCSAVNGEGLKMAIDWLIEKIKKSRRTELIRRKTLGG